MCSLGIEPTTFCAADAMLYHWATQEHHSELPQITRLLIVLYILIVIISTRLKLFDTHTQPHTHHHTTPHTTKPTQTHNTHTQHTHTPHTHNHTHTHTHTTPTHTHHTHHTHTLTTIKTMDELDVPRNKTIAHGSECNCLIVGLMYDITFHKNRPTLTVELWLYSYWTEHLVNILSNEHGVK